MEKVDRELLMELVEKDEELRELYNEHIELERQLEQFETTPPYSPLAEMREKELKKQKLRGMDTILSKLCEYRRQDETMSEANAA